MVPRSANNAGDPFDDLSGFVPGGYIRENVTVQLWWPRPGFMVSRVLGHLDAGGAHFLADGLRAHVATLGKTTRTIGFHEWARMSDYDSEARIVLTGVARETLARSDGIHLLVQSSLVAFGVRTASVALTNVVVYSARASFEAALASSLRHVPQAPVLEERADELRVKACSRCGAELPNEMGTAYSLISNGWRLSRPTGTQKPQWHCPACWGLQKKRTAP